MNPVSGWASGSPKHGPKRVPSFLMAVTTLGKIYGAGDLIDITSAHLSASSHFYRHLVSVSDNIPKTERFLDGIGAEIIRTSGESFMDDLHQAFSAMDGETVRRVGNTPLYIREGGGRNRVLSGLCIMNRPRTLAGD